MNEIVATAEAVPTFTGHIVWGVDHTNTTWYVTAAQVYTGTIGAIWVQDQPPAVKDHDKALDQLLLP